MAIGPGPFGSSDDKLLAGLNRCAAGIRSRQPVFDLAAVRNQYFAPFANFPQPGAAALIHKANTEPSRPGPVLSCAAARFRPIHIGRYTTLGD